MKASKFIVLAAGVIGIVAFFLPLIAISQQGILGTLTPMQFANGISSLEEVASAGKIMKGSPEEKQAVAEFNKMAQDLRIVVLVCFAPAVMCALFGLIGALKGSFGRGLGAGALIFGLLTFGVWLILNTAASEASVQGESGDVRGIGMWLLLVSGATAAIGGLLALIKPDRGAAASSTPRYAATIKA